MNSVVRFRNDICLTIKSPGEALIIQNGRVFRLDGEAYGLVTALIDGERTDRQIVDLLAGDLEAAAVYYVLEVLRRHDFLANGSLQDTPLNPPLRGLIRVERLLDIGCNRGQFLLAALRFWKPSRVVAVDMQADELEWARRNVALCRPPTKVDFYCCAVGPQARQVEYWKSEFSPSSSIQPPNALMKREFGLLNSTSRPESVPMRTIDEISAEAGLESVDLLKLDIEGYELPALSAASETLKRTSHVLIEVTFGRLREHELDEVSAFLCPLGFTPVHIVNPWCAADGRLLAGDVLFSRGRRTKLWAAL
ncbi:MAG: FkbM family methyltransferase [Bryobacterales bacterium]|nr:FkbM family methyltransferase [Bryobacterales bacterium]